MVKKRWVVKLGTGILTRADGRIDSAQISQLCKQVAALVQDGYQIVLVSSGAIGAGMTAMQLNKRPTAITELQACATVGQISLMSEYQRRLEKDGLLGAQLLLTYWDLDSRTCYDNARKVIDLLLAKKRFVPIINENDAISGEELRPQSRGGFGDNDNLSAQVAILIGAERLIILSNVDGLLSKNNGTSEVIPRVTCIDDALRRLASGPSNERSVGGMITKIEAAQNAAVHGVETIIANGRNKSILHQIAAGAFLGTRFQLGTPARKPSKVGTAS